MISLCWSASELSRFWIPIAAQWWRGHPRDGITQPPSAQPQPPSATPGSSCRWAAVPVWIKSTRCSMEAWRWRKVNARLLRTSRIAPLQRVLLGFAHAKDLSSSVANSLSRFSAKLSSKNPPDSARFFSKIF